MAPLPLPDTCLVLGTLTDFESLVLDLGNSVSGVRSITVLVARRWFPVPLLSAFLVCCALGIRASFRHTLHRRKLLPLRHRLVRTLPLDDRTRLGNVFPKADEAKFSNELKWKGRFTVLRKIFHRR